MQALQTDTTSIPLPRRVKISSKRQLTIPVDIYQRQGFSEYAMLTETPEGLVIQPLKLADSDEELTLKLLRYLMERGLQGEELLSAYEELKPKFASYFRAVEAAESDIATGNVIDFDNMQADIKAKYGL